MTGTFITFEGGEGSGKSTQIDLLYKAFETTGIACVKTREPGGTPGAEKIRDLLVNGKTDAWDPVAETLLFYAARLNHVNTLIKPALAKGQTVICDRFADSTLVYQGIGKNLSETYIQTLHKLVLGDFAPDLTIILDLEPESGLKRALKRGVTLASEGKEQENRFESMNSAFHRRVRDGFLAIAQREPNRCLVLDAAQEKSALHRQIIAAINKRLGLSLKPSC